MTINIQENRSNYQLNPTYYFGGFTFLFLVLQLFSGVFLMMNFIPTVQKAYPSLVFITNTLPYGVFIRTGHRYAAFIMLILCILHLVRMWATDKFTYPRNIGWITGVILLFVTIAIIFSGFLTSFDSVPQILLNDLAKLLNIGKRDFQKLLSFYYMIHLLLPAGLFLLLIVHFSRIARPKIFPPLSQTLISFGLLSILSALIPIKELTEKPLKTINPPFGVSTIGLIFGIIVLILLFLCFLPFLVKRKRVLAHINEGRCTGCMYCADVCPKKAIEEKSKKVNGVKKQIAFVIEKKCQGCGICVGACRSSVIQLDGSDDSFILEEVNSVWLNKI